MTELLSVEEVARILHLHQMTVRRHIRQGRLKAVKVGGRVRIRAEDLEAFMRPMKAEGIPPRVPQPRAPTEADLERRRALANSAERLRKQIGSIDISTSELIRMGREERGHV